MTQINSKFHYLFFTALLFIVASCDGVRVDPTGMGVRVQLDQSSITTGPGDLQFGEGFIRLSEIEFEGEKGDSLEIEVEIDQTTTIDLLTGVADPALPNLVIPAGTYEEFELEVKGADDGGTVIFLKGSFVDSTQNQVPIEIDVREEFSLELEWENYTVDSTTSFGATFFIDPAVWFDSFTLQDSDQAARTSGVVIISPDDNPDLYARLTSRLPEGIEWEWDD